MPLPRPPKSKSKTARRNYVSEIIRRERHAGKPIRQAIAIAMKAAGLSRKKMVQLAYPIHQLQYWLRIAADGMPYW